MGSDRTSVTKKHKISRDSDALCFSIVTKHRTLDLQAPNLETVSEWYDKLCRLFVRATHLSVA